MNMHWVTCSINLSGQNYNTVVIGAHEPMSWPEAQLMMAMHGEENVFGIKPTAVSDTTPRAEKERLHTKYRSAAGYIEQCFPGRSPRMEMTMPGEPEDLRRLDFEGRPMLSAPIGGNGDDDDDEGDEARQEHGLEPPTGGAVFKPGRARPITGA